MYGFGEPEFELRDGKLISCSTFEADVVLPDGITEIGDCAFRLCPNLRAIRIPDSVTKLGKSPFQGCHSLTSIHIPAHLLEGMDLMSAIELFAENPMNYPSQEQRFVRLLLDGTGDFSDAFRELIAGRLLHPFHLRRWLRISISEDQPQWVEKILSFHETLPRTVIDECVDLATKPENPQILAILINYTHNHTIAEEFLSDEW